MLFFSWRTLGEPSHAELKLFWDAALSLSALTSLDTNVGKTKFKNQTKLIKFADFSMEVEGFKVVCDAEFNFEIGFFIRASKSAF